MFHKVILSIPTTTLAAVAITKKTSGECPHRPETKNHWECTRSNLPIYSSLHSLDAPKRDTHPPKSSAAYEAIETGVRTLRTEVQSGYQALEDQLQSVTSYVDTAKTHTLSTIDYLNQPQNVLPRSGAIAIGGLSGFIFAARGGFIKKVLYTSIGAGAIASLCYPKAAEQYARDALIEARKGYAIAYNFIKGVKPGEGIPLEPINKFPTSVAELKDFVWDLYDEAKEAVFSKKK